MASQFCKSCDSCHRNVTGCLATCWIVQNASWSQLEPGKMITPNFMENTFSSFRGHFKSSMKKIAAWLAGGSLRNAGYWLINSVRLARSRRRRWRHCVRSARHSRPTRNHLFMEVHHVAVPMLGMHGLQLLPLIQRQHLAQIQIHHGELALQPAASAEHLVHLCAYLTFVGHIGVEQVLQLHVLLFHLRP